VKRESVANEEDGQQHSLRLKRTSNRFHFWFQTNSFWRTWKSGKIEESIIPTIIVIAGQLEILELENNGLCESERGSLTGRELARNLASVMIAANAAPVESPAIPIREGK
jgi:hypothetical protein